MLADKVLRRLVHGIHVKLAGNVPNEIAREHRRHVALCDEVAVLAGNGIETRGKTLRTFLCVTHDPVIVRERVQ